jgi:hypothetical protein
MANKKYLLNQGKWKLLLFIFMHPGNVFLNPEDYLPVPARSLP